MSNSKLLTSFLEWNSGLTFLRFQQASLHSFALQQIGGLLFRFNLTPQFDRHDDRCGFATLVRYVLNFQHKQPQLQTYSTKSIAARSDPTRPKPQFLAMSAEAEERLNRQLAYRTKYRRDAYQIAGKPDRN